MERCFFVEQTRFGVSVKLCFKCAVHNVIRDEREGVLAEVKMIIKKVKGGDPMFCNQCSNAISYE